MVLTQNTLILVYYINVDAFDNTESKNKYLEEVKNIVTGGIDGCFLIVLPVTKENSRVECINPKYMSADEYKRIEENIDKADKQLKKFIASFDHPNY